MAKASWTVGIKPFVGSTTYYTTYVRSIDYQWLRRSYLDQFTGNSVRVTLNNQTNVAQYFTFGANLVINDNWYFTIIGVDFDDYPGNTGQSTCTVTAMDNLALAGRQTVSNLSLPGVDAQTQLSTVWTTANTVLQVSGGTSVASANTYTGTMLQRLQQNVTCEQSAVQLYNNKIILAGRAVSKNSATPATVFTRATSSGSNISYNEITRIRADLDMANTITVNQTTASPVSASATGSTAVYGSQSDSVSACDSSNNTDLAQWLANTRSDPTTQRYEITVYDQSQTQGAIDQINYVLFADVATWKVCSLVYRVPGAAADTTEYVFLEGCQISVNPERTTYRFYLSPMTYYQYFILDDAVQGILDTSRLGW